MSNPDPHTAEYALLDNPIWNSLLTEHAHLAVGADVGCGLARRYPSDIGPLSGFQEPTVDAYSDLAAILPEGEVALLCLSKKPCPPLNWEFVREGMLVQMVCTVIPEEVSISETIIPLETADFPEMAALATLTEPGPFRANTALLGGFLGIRVEGRLVGMAGRRMAPTGFLEVSAVCSHPDYRGRGYANALVTAVARTIHSEGCIPFLTVLQANVGAIRIYEQLGFVLRRAFHLAVLKPSQ
jgi:GNAT superfamily N-acetyltransferase